MEKKVKRTKSIQTPLTLSVHFLPSSELILFVLLDTNKRNIMNMLNASHAKLSKPSPAASAILKKYENVDKENSCTANDP